MSSSRGHPPQEIRAGVVGEIDPGPGALQKLRRASREVVAHLPRPVGDLLVVAAHALLGPQKRLRASEGRLLVAARPTAIEAVLAAPLAGRDPSREGVAVLLAQEDLVEVRVVDVLAVRGALHVRQWQPPRGAVRSPGDAVGRGGVALAERQQRQLAVAQDDVIDAVERVQLPPPVRRGVAAHDDPDLGVDLAQRPRQQQRAVDVVEPLEADPDEPGPHAGHQGFERARHLVLGSRPRHRAGRRPRCRCGAGSSRDRGSRRWPRRFRRREGGLERGRDGHA